MAGIKMPHAQHEQHLYLLQNIKTNPDEVKKLVRNPRFICKGCGRVAAEGKTYVRLKNCNEALHSKVI